MNRRQREEIASAIRENRKDSELQTEVDWVMKANDFLQTYSGDHPVLRSLARRAKKPNWVPSVHQAVQVHRIVHRESIGAAQRRRMVDSLGRRVREREGPMLPDSLSEPDWL